MSWGSRYMKQYGKEYLLDMSITKRFVLVQFPQRYQKFFSHIIFIDQLDSESYGAVQTNFGENGVFAKGGQ